MTPEFVRAARWARANGWTAKTWPSRFMCPRVLPDYGWRKDSLHVSVHRYDDVYTLTVVDWSLTSPYRIELTPPGGVRQAINLLVDLGILPDEFHSLSPRMDPGEWCPRCRHPLASHGDECADCDCALPAKAVQWLNRKLADEKGAR